MGRKENLVAARWIPSDSIVVRPNGVDAIVYYKSYGERCSAVGYAGSAKNASFVYSFRNEASRDKYVADWIDGLKRSASFKAERAAKKKAFVPSLKVGDVLSTSWGYDQTNVEFSQVTKLIGKSMVEIRELAQMSEDTGFMCGRCAPIQGKFLDKAPLRKRVLEGNALDIHGGFGYARLYEMKEVAPGVKVGNPKYWSSYA